MSTFSYTKDERTVGAVQGARAIGVSASFQMWKAITGNLATPRLSLIEVATASVEVKLNV